MLLLTGIGRTQTLNHPWLAELVAFSCSLKANSMNDLKFMRDKLIEIRRWFIITLSFLFTSWLLVLVVAKGMFGSQGEETEVAFLLRIVLYALAAGCASGILWGGSGLRRIEIVMLPAAVVLGLVLIVTPFMVYETISNPPTEGITYALIGTGAILGMLLCMTLFPLLGPVVSFALWNNKRPGEMREELVQVWNDFKMIFMPIKP